MNEKDILQEAIDTFGRPAQLRQATEEMAELIVLLMKDFRLEDVRDRVIDEVSDIEIMMEQLKKIYNIHSEVEKRKEYKKLKLSKYIESYKNNQIKESKYASEAWNNVLDITKKFSSALSDEDKNAVLTSLDILRPIILKENGAK